MSEVKSSPGSEAAVRPRASLVQDWRQYVVYAGFLIIFLFFAITLQDRGFLHANNLLNIARQTAMVAVMAVTMTFVLSAGEIDLSVGSVAGLASVVAAMGVGYFGLIGGIIGGLVTGIVMGLINGLLTTAIGIPSFLVTLAMMGIATGTAMWISNTAAIPIIDRTYNFFFGSGNFGPVPTLLVWMAIFAVIGHIALRRTSFAARCWRPAAARRRRGIAASIRAASSCGFCCSPPWRLRLRACSTPAACTPGGSRWARAMSFRSSPQPFLAAPASSAAGAR